MLFRTPIGSCVTLWPLTIPSPAVALQQRRQKANRRALAGAVGADEPEHLARGDLQVQIRHGHKVAVSLREISQFDHRARIRDAGYGGQGFVAIRRVTVRSSSRRILNLSYHVAAAC